MTRPKRKSLVPEHVPKFARRPTSLGGSIPPRPLRNSSLPREDGLTALESYRLRKNIIPPKGVGSTALEISGLRKIQKLQPTEDEEKPQKQQKLNPRKSLVTNTKSGGSGDTTNIHRLDLPVVGLENAWLNENNSSLKKASRTPDEKYRDLEIYKQVENRKILPTVDGAPSDSLLTSALRKACRTRTNKLNREVVLGSPEIAVLNKGSHSTSFDRLNNIVSHPSEYGIGTPESSHRILNSDKSLESDNTMVLERSRASLLMGRYAMVRSNHYLQYDEVLDPDFSSVRQNVNHQIIGIESDRTTTTATKSLAVDAVVTTLNIELATAQAPLQEKDQTPLEEKVKQLMREKEDMCDKILGYIQRESEMVKEHELTRNDILGLREREAKMIHKIRCLDSIRRAQHNEIMKLKGNIRVFVRFRPENEWERSNRDEQNDPFFRFSCIDDFSRSRSVDLTKNEVEVLGPRTDRKGLRSSRKLHHFEFDNVFTPKTSQKDIWDATEPLVQSSIDGFNVTLISYGQTGKSVIYFMTLLEVHFLTLFAMKGSGKTYTMLGDDQNKGIIGRAVEKLFVAKNEIENVSGGETVAISVEILEVYNDTVRDLLSLSSARNVEVMSEKVEGNITISTPTEDEALELFSRAQSKRILKSTNLNTESSRSHIVFTIHFDVSTEGGTKRSGKLNICDLAGSESLSKSGANVVGVSHFYYHS
jgi:Kinesin motor domain